MGMRCLVTGGSSTFSHLVLAASGVVLTLLLLGCAGKSVTTIDDGRANAWSGGGAMAPPDSPLPAGVYDALGASEIQSQLDRLPLPPGLDLAAYAQMKTALWHSLGAGGGAARYTATAPTTPDGGVNDLAVNVHFDEMSAVFTWSYRNPGDYDQNSQVNVADLTPLGQYFGATSADPLWNLARVADGDGNGQLTIADITPIGANFLATVEGYALQRSDQPSNPASWADVPGAYFMFAASVLPGGGGLRRFSLPVKGVEEGMHYRVVSYDGPSRGTPGNVVTVPVNAPPQAALSFTAVSLATPAEIHYSASASTDDRGIVKYEWDFDNDGDYEYDSGLEPETVFYYYAPGGYPARVRVTDTDGLTGIDGTGVTIMLGASWHTQPIATTLYSEGYDLTMLDLNGLPAIAYSSRHTNVTPVDEDTMYFAISADEHGDVWNQPSIVQQGFGTGSPFVASVIGDRPAVFFWTGLLGYGLTYLRANDSIGSSWPAVQTLISTISNGPDSISISAINGLPFVAWDLGGPAFSIATDLSGNVWSVPCVLDTGSIEMSWSIGLAEIEGKAALAYHDRNSGYLKYLKATNNESSQWPLPTQVVPVGDVGSYPLLAELNARPAIAYYDDTTKSLKLTIGIDCEGSSWSQPVGIVNGSSHYFDTLKLDERLAVVYWEYDSPRIMFTAANDSAGAAWSLPMQVANNMLGPGGSRLSCEAVAGMPAVAYSTFVDDPRTSGDHLDLYFSSYY